MLPKKSETAKMFKTAKEIREHYDRLRHKAMTQLRASCKHEKVSDWDTEWWALAHSTGFEIRYCKICETILHRKTRCSNIVGGKQCGKEIVDDEIFEGDGKTLPIGGHYCKKCWQSSRGSLGRPIQRGPSAEAQIRRMRRRPFESVS
jgi:hypothetical protein